jgi:hypothetical protein
MCLAFECVEVLAKPNLVLSAIDHACLKSYINFNVSGQTEAKYNVNL